MVAVKAGDADAALARFTGSPPIVLLFGPDAGLVSERAARTAAAIAGDSDPMNTVRLDGDVIAADPARLADEAWTVAMFGGRRVLRVRLGARNVLPALEPLLADPPRDAVVILEAGDLKRGNALRERIERAQGAWAVACYGDAARDLDRLIDSELRAAGLTIDRDARELLASLLGGDRLASRGEVQKLVLYAQGQSRLTVENVEAIVGDASATGLDEAVDSAFAGDAKTTEVALGRLLSAGVSAQSVILAAIRAAAALHRWRIKVEAGEPPRAVLDAVKPMIPFRRRPRLERALSAWTAATAERTLIDLGAALAEARKQATLAEAITSRALLVLATATARRARRGG